MARSVVVLDFAVSFAPSLIWKARATVSCTGAKAEAARLTARRMIPERVFIRRLCTV